MRESIVRDLVILLAIFGGIWLVFIYVPIFPEADLTMSIENEEKLGEVILENVLSYDPNFKAIKDDEVDSVMNVITGRLLDHIGLTDYEYNIRVVRSEQINAVTLPGGNILVFAGLIDFTESPEELAAVIAHEIGHVEKRHVVTKLMKEFTIEIIFGVLTGGDGALLSEIVKTSFSTTFDRAQEREADRYGLDLLTKSNVSPRSMAAFFRRLTREYGNFDENLELIMTHPNNNSRIKASMEYKLPDGFEEDRFQLDWDGFRTKVNSL